MNNSIELATNNLFEEIIHSGIYQQVQTLKLELDQNVILTQTIANIKLLQKKSMAKPSIDLQKELNDQMHALYNNDLYIRYQNATDRLNELIRAINDQINHHIIDLTDINMIEKNHGS